MELEQKIKRFEISEKNFLDPKKSPKNRKVALLSYFEKQKSILKRSATIEKNGPVTSLNEISVHVFFWVPKSGGSTAVGQRYISNAIKTTNAMWSMAKDT